MMAAMTPQHIMAQDSNEEMSDNDIDIKSLYEMVSKHEKKSEAVNLYFNYGACCQMTRVRVSGPHGSTTATCDWRCADGSQTTSFTVSVIG